MGVHSPIAEFGIQLAFILACHWMHYLMLRITIQENENSMVIKLEGRIAGPYVAELSRVWGDRAPFPSTKKLTLDLHNVLNLDSYGRQVLREIYIQTNAELVTGTPWTQSLAQQIMRSDAHPDNEEL